MGKLLLITFFLTVYTTQSQNSQLFLSEALDHNIPRYLLEVENAIENGEQENVKEIFQKLVSEKLVAAYMDNVVAKNLSRKNKELASYEKPVLLITNPAWRLNCKGEQPALNKLAGKYGDRVDIIMLYWGDLKTVKKLSKDYDRDIEILYVDDSDNEYSRIIKSLKHSLGLPLAFTISGQKQIVDIQNRLSNRMSVSIEESSEQNLTFYEKMLKKVLFEESKSHTIPTASLD